MGLASWKKIVTRYTKKCCCWKDISSWKIVLWEQHFVRATLALVLPFSGIRELQTRLRRQQMASKLPK